jgi:hypothetical protein
VRLGRLTTATALVIAVTACSSSHGAFAPSTSTSARSTSTSGPTTVPPTPPITRPDRSIEVYDDCTAAHFEPTGIRFACADNGEGLQDLTWTSWTSTSATAIGTVFYKDCRPNCAEGQVHTIPGVKVTLTSPVRDPRGQLVWSEVELNTNPPGYQSGPQSLPTRQI